MPVTAEEQTKPCEMSLDIEVEPEAVKKAFDEAYREVGKRAQVPGFRRGKAPRPVLERYLSEEAVKEEARDRLVQPAFKSALEETGVEPFGDAEYEVIHLEDAETFKFKARVPLAPKVELGDYVGLKVEKVTPKVGDEDIQREIDDIRERFAESTDIEDRPVKEGDLAVLRLVDPNGETQETVVEAGKNLPSFDLGLIGMSLDETKSIELVYPEDYEDKDLAGRISHVTATVTGIKERHVPELTDELVKKISGTSEEKIETVEDLRKKIREAMEKAAEDVADRQVESSIVEKVVGAAKVDYPEQMLDHEVSHRFQDLLKELKRRKMEFEDYLRATNNTFEQFRTKLESSAGRDLTVNLAILEVAKRENIEVTDEDIEAEVTKMAGESGVPKESLQAYLDKTDGKGSIGSRLLRRKVLDFLINASNIKSVGRKAS